MGKVPLSPPGIGHQVEAATTLTQGDLSIARRPEPFNI